MHSEVHVNVHRNEDAQKTDTISLCACGDDVGSNVCLNGSIYLCEVDTFDGE